MKIIEREYPFEQFLEYFQTDSLTIWKVPKNKAIEKNTLCLV